MESRKEKLLQRIGSDREVLVDFLRGFVHCPSSNPPGGTGQAAVHIRQFLDRHGAKYRVVALNEVMPNIVATFEAGKPGSNLALNGHIACFPVGDGAGRTHDPWGSELVGGRIYGTTNCRQVVGGCREVGLGTSE
jgi:succinyl-diaminopimelate desuccinylase